MHLILLQSLLGIKTFSYNQCFCKDFSKAKAGKGRHDSDSSIIVNSIVRASVDVNSAPVPSSAIHNVNYIKNNKNNINNNKNQHNDVNSAPVPSSVSKSPPYTDSFSLLPTAT